jgi:hypothetical protein
MVTTASKLYFGAAAVAMLAAWVYGWGTGGGLSGVIFLGFTGGVGEQAGYTILQVTSAILLGLGVAASALRDADPEASIAAARLETLPALVPAGGGYWPVLGAAAVVAAAVGLVASPVVFVIGLIAAGLVMIEWTVLAWSERATGDPAVNRRIRNRLMNPIEIPVAGALAILILVVSVSRILLAISKDASSITAIVIALLILGLGFAIAYRPKMSKDAVAAILGVIVLIVIGAGIVAAGTGSREFEHHEEESGEVAPEGAESGG